MKALAIVALVFAGLSIFIPVGGIFIAMICSVVALISFRSQPTFSGIIFGIDIVNTAFLSPSIVMTDLASAGKLGTEMTALAAGGKATAGGEIYWLYVGFHVVLLAIALVWKFLRRNATSAEQPVRV